MHDATTSWREAVNSIALSPLFTIYPAFNITSLQMSSSRNNGDRCANGARFDVLKQGNVQAGPELPSVTSILNVVVAGLQQARSMLFTGRSHVTHMDRVMNKAINDSGY